MAQASVHRSRRSIGEASSVQWDDVYILFSELCWNPVPIPFFNPMSRTNLRRIQPVWDLADACRSTRFMFSSVIRRTSATLPGTCTSVVPPKVEARKDKAVCGLGLYRARALNRHPGKYCKEIRRREFVKYCMDIRRCKLEIADSQMVYVNIA